MNNENNIKRDDKLDLVSMIIGIVSLCIPALGMIYAPIAGLILAFKCKEKTKKRKAGIILNIIALVLQVGFLVVFLLAMSTDSITSDEYEANKTFTNLSMYIPEDWTNVEEEDWGFNSAKTYVYRNFEYIDNWETTDLETDIIKGGEKNKKSLCEITIKDYSEAYKMYESFTNQNYSDSEKYKLNKESFDISKNDILLEQKLTKKEFNDIEFEYAVDNSTHSTTHYYFLDAGNNGLYEIVIWDMKNCDKYIEHIEESFELDENSSNNVQNDNEINNDATEDDKQYNVIKENFDASNFKNYNFIDVKTYDKSSNGSILHDSKSWIKYEDSNKIEIKRSSNCIGDNKPIHYELSLNSGILTITDMISENLDSYTFKNITNIKQIMEFSSGQSCADVNIIILTEEGKIYYHSNTELVKNGTLKYDFSTLESEFKLFNSNYIFDKIGNSHYFAIGSRVLGAITKNAEEINLNLFSQETYGPIDSAIYDYITTMYSTPLFIGFDNSIWFEENKYIVDQSSQKVYINYGFYYENITEDNNDLVYIIDRQGYLYSINSSNIDNIAIKKSDKKVQKIGSNNKNFYGKSILIFEDNSYMEIYMDDPFGI